MFTNVYKNFQNAFTATINSTQYSILIEQLAQLSTIMIFIKSQNNEDIVNC